MSRQRDQYNAIWEKLRQKTAEVDAKLLGLPYIPVVRLPPPDRFKNKWERDYARTHLDPMLHTCQIQKWAYECVKFRLATGAYFTPDFMVWLPGESIEIHELKGYLREAGRIRFLMARELYPTFHWKMIERKHGQWREKQL